MNLSVVNAISVGSREDSHTSSLAQPQSPTQIQNQRQFQHIKASKSMDLGTTQNQQPTGGESLLSICTAWWLDAFFPLRKLKHSGWGMAHCIIVMLLKATCTMHSYLLLHIEEGNQVCLLHDVCTMCVFGVIRSFVLYGHHNNVCTLWVCVMLPVRSSCFWTMTQFLLFCCDTYPQWIWN